MESNLNIEMLRDFANKTMTPNSEVWLYGSRARNDWRDYSDWDLLVLLNKDKIEDSDFDKYAYSFIVYGAEHGAEVSPQIYTFKEWEQSKITPYYKNVEHDKQWIYGAR